MVDWPKPPPIDLEMLRQLLSDALEAAPGPKAREAQAAAIETLMALGIWSDKPPGGVVGGVFDMLGDWKNTVAEATGVGMSGVPTPYEQVGPRFRPPDMRHLVDIGQRMGSRLNAGAFGPWDLFPGGLEAYLQYIMGGMGLPREDVRT